MEESRSKRGARNTGPLDAALAPNAWLQRAVDWVERHPRTVLTGALLAGALVFTLAQVLPGSTDSLSDDTETPLFI